MAYDGNWISQLVVTDPAGTELKQLGDNAIREIKRALKSSFPNAVADDSYTGTLSALDTAVAGAAPAGTIVAWYGSFISFPTGPDGWSICDGTNGTPDLRSRFIMGGTPAGGLLPEFELNYRGGDTELDVTILGGSTYTEYTSEGTTLSAAQSGLPAHSHTVTAGLVDATKRYDGSPADYQQVTNQSLTTSTVPAQDASLSHSHNFNIKADRDNLTLANLPLYHVLTYIMKDA